ncbi:MAG: hypothetical protein E8D45_02765 [Nitrospira sp.]|nr:MAG: hypothetical protein E8D45_02765 [Nitrospira sp.]
MQVSRLSTQSPLGRATGHTFGSLISQGQVFLLSHDGSPRLRRGFPVFIFLAGALSACAAPVVPPYETLDPGTLLTAVKGQVTFVGNVPDVQFSRIYRDSKLCGEEVLAEELSIAEGSKGIEGVVVSLEGITMGKPKPKEEQVVIENRSCRFSPYVATTVVGSTLEVQNTDPILHTTHARFETRYGQTLWNVVQQGGDPGVNKTLTVPGLVDVRCDLHPNMRSFVHVFNHPYFTLTDADGRFELTNVPAGNYQLRAWHARLGAREKPITVPARGVITSEVVMELRRQ